MDVHAKQFDKVKVQISLVPDAVTNRLTLTVNVIRNVHIQNTNDGKFTPWFPVRNRFGGIDAIAETFQLYDNQIQFKIDINAYGKYFRDPRVNIISFIGYFDNVYSANRQLKRAKIDIIECLKYERVLNDDLQRQISELKI